MSPAADQNLKIGEILVKEGYLTPEDQQKVLDLQKEQLQRSLDQLVLGAGSNYRPFGQICVELGLINSQELQRILLRHNKRIRLGELLINQGLIKPNHLLAALKTQESSTLKLGEILLEAGAINRSQLLDALSLQLDAPRMMPSSELLDSALMDHFPLDFYKDHLCLPMYQSGQELTVVMADPQNPKLLTELERSFRCRISPALATSEDILQTLKEYERYSALPGLMPLSESVTLLAANEKPPPENSSQPQPKKAATGPLVPAAEQTRVGGSNVYTEAQPLRQEEQVVSFLIKNALKDRASDIHIEPQEKHIRIRYRIDGVLHHKTDLPTHLGPLMLKRLKELCHLEPDKQGHQHKRVEAQVNEHQLELDIATYPSAWGEAVVLHLQEIQSSTRELLLNLERIGFSPLYLRRYQHLLAQPGGLIIVTGPASAGKTSTLYASINHLNQQNRSIITAERRTEFLVPGTVQGTFAAEHGSFAEMICSMIRLDPDILMVSEIENADTLEAVVEVALTGAKVMTSFEAFDATGALLRLNRLGLENYLIASSNVTVLSQRLVRRLCPSCRQPHPPEELDQSLFNRLGLVDVTPESFPFYRAVGCDACSQRGYKGQLAIHELLHLNEAIREAVLDHKPAATIRGIARTEAKLVSMAEDGLYKVIEGLTSLEEIQRVAFVNEYDSQTPWEAAEIHRICKGLEAEFI